MKNKIFLAVTAAFLLNSTIAQAALKTFNFTFDGASNIGTKNSGIATGFVTLDTDFIGTDRMTNIPINQVVDLRMTVTGFGAGLGDGVFTKSDFSQVKFNSISPLDFSRQLVGQTLSNGRQWGSPDDSATGSFSFYRSNPSAPMFFYWYELYTNAKTVTLSLLTAVAAVPEADTSAMLLMGAGVMGFIARRRKNTQA
jgi:hypothetical protein